MFRKDKDKKKITQDDTELENKLDQELEPKKLALRTVLFVVFVVIAVAAFAAGISGIGRKEAGLYEVEAEPDEEAPLYAGEMTLQYRFDGSSGEIRAALQELRGVYSAALKRACIYFDGGTARDGWTNLATLNASPGQVVEVDPSLFAALTDAYDRTLRQEGYNLFAGPLYAAWTEILYLEDPEPIDPLNDPQSRARLERIASVVNDLDNFRFEVVDEQRCSVRVEWSDAVRDLLAEYELPQTVLDLNVLRDAYELRYVAETLESRGWRAGYLTTPTGLALALSGFETGEYCLYGRIGDDVVPAATADAGQSTAFSQVRVFPYREGEYGFYSVKTGGEDVLRHPYLTATGAYPGAWESSCVLALDGDVVAARWENLRLNACATAAEAEALARASARPIAWLLPGEEKTVHRNAAAETRIEPEADYGFTAG